MTKATRYDSKKTGTRLYNEDSYILIFLYSYFNISTLPFTENKSAYLLSTKLFSGEPNTPTNICRRKQCPYEQQAGT